MLEIKRKTHNIKIDDVIYELKEPSVAQIRSLAKVDEKEAFDRMLELLVELGLPYEVIQSLPMQGLEDIGALIIPKKKN